MVFWVVARVLLGCSGQLLVLLCVCQSVLGGCQGVARVFWAVTCVAMCLPECSGWLLGCCYVVTRVIGLIYCLFKTPCYDRVFIGVCQGVDRVF